MTLLQLREKVRNWDLQYSGTTEPSKYGSILKQLDFHATREWRMYLPAENPDFNASYMERLAAWIGNVKSDNEQKLLLEYALFISFFSHDDFAALYRTAMDREISRWVAMQIGAKLEPGGPQAFSNLVRREIEYHTWFCPITDSMDINEFYKVNHLKGIEHRPGFATLQMLAEMHNAQIPEIANNIRNYMSSSARDRNNQIIPLKRLVLLEDIVGSGNQCIRAVGWAVNAIRVPTLFVPLILCPNGAEALRKTEAVSEGLLTVRPVIELRRSDLLGPERKGADGWPIATALEGFAKNYRKRLSRHRNPFGFESTGCSIATFANTPNNTLPLVHDKPRAGTWHPLFPRVFRN